MHVFLKEYRPSVYVLHRWIRTAHVTSSAYVVKRKMWSTRKEKLVVDHAKGLHFCDYSIPFLTGMYLYRFKLTKDCISQFLKYRGPPALLLFTTKDDRFYCEFKDRFIYLRTPSFGGSDVLQRKRPRNLSRMSWSPFAYGIIQSRSVGV